MAQTPAPATDSRLPVATAGGASPDPAAAPAPDLAHAAPPRPARSPPLGPLSLPGSDPSRLHLFHLHEYQAPDTLSAMARTRHPHEHYDCRPHRYLAPTSTLAPCTCSTCTCTCTCSTCTCSTGTCTCSTCTCTQDPLLFHGPCCTRSHHAEPATFPAGSEAHAALPDTRAFLNLLGDMSSTEVGRATSDTAAAASEVFRCACVALRRINGAALHGRRCRICAWHCVAWTAQRRMRMAQRRMRMALRRVCMALRRMELRSMDGAAAHAHGTAAHAHGTAAYERQGGV
eukprot:357124-Chlamydomonas_euryale.AAC.4